jgi:hypothetical protein
MEMDCAIKSSVASLQVEVTFISFSNDFQNKINKAVTAARIYHTFT